jgi:hypothetical protein
MVTLNNRKYILNLFDSAGQVKQKTKKNLGFFFISIFFFYQGRI